MTTVATMLDDHPRRAAVDTQLHGDTIEVLTEVARTARQCADACLHERGADLRHCIALDMDVAELANATAGMLIRFADPPALVAALEACRATLRACAEACRSHGAHMRHCAVCAEACERAEEQCVQMAAAVSHVSVVGPDALPAAIDVTEEHHRISI